MSCIMDTQSNMPDFLVQKNLAEAAQIKAERAIAACFLAEEYDAKKKAIFIAKLEKRIIHLQEAVETNYSSEMVKALENLGYNLDIYLDEMKAMLRNSERELNELLGFPPSAEELEEKVLQNTFVSLSFKAGMYAYVREDILDSAAYYLDIKAYWNEHIEACQNAIDAKIPLCHYE